MEKPESLSACRPESRIVELTQPDDDDDDDDKKKIEKTDNELELLLLSGGGMTISDQMGMEEEIDCTKNHSNNLEVPQRRAESPTLRDVHRKSPEVFKSATKQTTAQNKPEYKSIITSELNATGRTSPTTTTTLQQHTLSFGGGLAEIQARQRVLSPVPHEFLTDATTNKTTTMIKYSIPVTHSEFAASFPAGSSYLDTSRPTDTDKKTLITALLKTTITKEYWTSVWKWMVARYLCTDWLRWWLKSYPAKELFSKNRNHPYVVTLQTYSETEIYKRLLQRENFVRWGIGEFFDERPTDPPPEIVLDKIEEYVMECLTILDEEAQNKHVPWSFDHWLSILQIEPSEALMDLHVRHFIKQTLQSSEIETDITSILTSTKNEEKRRDLFYYASLKGNRSVVQYLLSKNITCLGSLDCFTHVRQNSSAYKKSVKRSPLLQWFARYCHLQNSLNEEIIPPQPYENLDYAITQGRRLDAFAITIRMILMLEQLDADEPIAFPYLEELEKKDKRHYETVIGHAFDFLESMEREEVIYNDDKNDNGDDGNKES